MARKLISKKMLETNKQSSNLQYIKDVESIVKNNQINDSLIYGNTMTSQEFESTIGTKNRVVVQFGGPIPMFSRKLQRSCYIVFDQNTTDDFDNNQIQVKTINNKLNEIIHISGAFSEYTNVLNSLNVKRQVYSPIFYITKKISINKATNEIEFPKTKIFINDYKYEVSSIKEIYYVYHKHAFNVMLFSSFVGLIMAFNNIKFNTNKNNEIEFNPDSQIMMSNIEFLCDKTIVEKKKHIKQELEKIALVDMIHLYKWKREILDKLKINSLTKKRLYIKLKSYEYSNLQDIFQQISFLKCINSFLSNQVNSTNYHEQIIMKKNNVFEFFSNIGIEDYKNKKQKSLLLDSCIKLGPIFNQPSSQLIPSFKFNETNTSFIYTFLNYDNIQEYQCESNTGLFNESIIQREYSGNYFSFFLIFNPKSNLEVINLLKEKIQNIKICGLKELNDQYYFVNNAGKYHTCDICLIIYSIKNKNEDDRNYFTNTKPILVNCFDYCYESSSKIINNQEKII